VATYVPQSCALPPHLQHEHMPPEASPELPHFTEHVSPPEPLPSFPEPVGFPPGHVIHISHADADDSLYASRLAGLWEHSDGDEPVAPRPRAHTDFPVAIGAHMAAGTADPVAADGPRRCLFALAALSVTSIA
jgi:hypothetical protein